MRVIRWLRDLFTERVNLLWGQCADFLSLLEIFEELSPSSSQKQRINQLITIARAYHIMRAHIPMRNPSFLKIRTHLY